MRNTIISLAYVSSYYSLDVLFFLAEQNQIMDLEMFFFQRHMIRALHHNHNSLPQLFYYLVLMYLTWYILYGKKVLFCGPDYSQENYTTNMLASFSVRKK